MLLASLSAYHWRKLFEDGRTNLKKNEPLSVCPYSAKTKESSKCINTLIHDDKSMSTAIWFGGFAPFRFPSVWNSETIYMKGMRFTDDNYRLS